jgi:hypothetical protein
MGDTTEPACLPWIGTQPPKRVPAPAMHHCEPSAVTEFHGSVPQSQRCRSQPRPRTAG